MGSLLEWFAGGVLNFFFLQNAFLGKKTEIRLLSKQLFQISRWHTLIALSSKA